MADHVKIKADADHELTIDCTKVEYNLDKTLVKFPLPVIATIVTGSDTAGTANKLTDSTKTFTTADVGRLIYNTTDSTFAIVTAYDSATVLSISSDIMDNTENYELWPVPIMNIMDLKQVSEAFTITGSLSGIASTNDLLLLRGLAYNLNNGALTFTWRELIFDDCWIKGFAVTDIMSISGTTAVGDSQTFNSGQIKDDTVTFTVIINLIRGAGMT